MVAAAALGATAALASFVLFSRMDGPTSLATQAFAVPVAAQVPPVIAVEDLPIVGVVEARNGDGVAEGFEDDATMEWVTVLNEVVVWSDREFANSERRDRERGDASEQVVSASSQASSPDDQLGTEPVESEPSRAGPFDRSAANAALEASAAAAKSCRQPETPPGAARVSVTFAPTGKVTTAIVMGAFAGTPEGGCIARTFRATRVEPFEGGLVTVHKTVAVR
jgi:hypothetical protein